MDGDPGGGGGGGMTKDVFGLNYKGLYSRERQPKGSAALIRARYWAIEANVTKCAQISGNSC